MRYNEVVKTSQMWNNEVSEVMFWQIYEQIRVLLKGGT